MPLYVLMSDVRVVLARTAPMYDAMKERWSAVQIMSCIFLYVGFSRHLCGCSKESTISGKFWYKPIIFRKKSVRSVSLVVEAVCGWCWSEHQSWVSRLFWRLQSLWNGLRKLDTEHVRMTMVWLSICIFHGKFTKYLVSVEQFHRSDSFIVLPLLPTGSEQLNMIVHEEGISSKLLRNYHFLICVFMKAGRGCSVFNLEFDDACHLNWIFMTRQPIASLLMWFTMNKHEDIELGAFVSLGFSQVLCSVIIADNKISQIFLIIYYVVFQWLWMYKT